MAKDEDEPASPPESEAKSSELKSSDKKRHKNGSNSSKGYHQTSEDGEQKTERRAHHKKKRKNAEGADASSHETKPLHEERLKKRSNRSRRRAEEEVVNGDPEEEANVVKTSSHESKPSDKEGHRKRRNRKERNADKEIVDDPDQEANAVQRGERRRKRTSEKKGESRDEEPRKSGKSRKPKRVDDGDAPLKCAKSLDESRSSKVTPILVPKKSKSLIKVDKDGVGKMLSPRLLGKGKMEKGSSLDVKAKNDAGGEEEEKDRSAVFADSIADLPEPLMKLVQKSTIKEDELSDRWEDTCIVLSALTKRPMLPKSAEKDYSPPKSEEHPWNNIEQIAELEAKIVSRDSPKKYYKIDKEIGKGGYGCVYLAKNLGKIPENKQKKVAVKKVEHISQKQKYMNLREVSFLLDLPHPNFVNMYKVHVQDNRMCSVMEYMEGGTMVEACKAHHFTEPQMAYLAHEMLKGLQHLHKNKLVHRDIKPHNIMLTTDGRVKLIDFGLVEDVEKVQADPRVAGSAHWMAPEVIRKIPYDERVDVWSVGITLAQIANGGQVPDHGPRFKAMFRTITVGKPNPLKDASKHSAVFQNFLSHCLKTNAEERPSARRMMSHAFVKLRSSQEEMADVLSRIFLESLFTF